jgi:signal transduction histidine kinase/ActR/RegA family two-component response regulator
MNANYGIIVFALGLAGLVLAASRLLRQARADRAARADTERQLRYSDQLQQLTATLSRARTPADVIHVCLPDMLHAASADAGAVVLVSDDQRHAEIAHAIGYDDAQIDRGRTRAVTSNSAVAESIRRRDMVVVGAPRSSESRARADDALLDQHAGAVVVPLIASNRAIGAIAMGFATARAVDGDEREFVLAAGRHIAQALDRARLYHEAERARSEAESFRARADAALRDRQVVEEALRQSEGRYRALAARTIRLYDLSAGLSTALTPAAIARVMVTRGKVVLGATAGSVAMLVHGEQAFEWLYSDESAATADHPRTFPADDEWCATRAVRSAAPVLVSSFAEWQEKYPASAALAADGGYVSSATLPLIANETAIGVVSFSFTVPVNFDDDYRALLASVAQHCAQALDRARLYETAERARAEAEAANRSKDDFLSTISHELRTPLNAILGWAVMLRNNSIDAARIPRAYEAIFNNATRQGRLIEELLDVSRIVAGRASVDLQEIDVVENLRGAVEAMMPAAAAKGIEIRFEAPASIPRVVADPRRTEQVFLNLLSNAVKFTPGNGRVEIQITVVDRSVAVRVSDTGHGIAPEFLPHVFDRFRQEDSATTRTVGGLGLGLFIARQLIEAQNGTLRAESEGPGRGASFTVTLPVSEAMATRPVASRTVPGMAARSGEPAPALAGVRVLLVDDEPDAREMMATALETCGATVVSAASARDAIQTLNREPVDVLLADIAMPEQDGYELIREIRSARTSASSSVPAAAVTAHARDDERQRALDAGFQMHLAKPVDPRTLARAVATLAGLKVPA